MLDIDYVLDCGQVEHELYEEDGHVFGVELNLFNGHKSYYHEKIKKYPYFDVVLVEGFQYLDDDIYNAIEQFNNMLKK